MDEKNRACGAPRLEELPRPYRELRQPVVDVGLRTTTPIYGGGVHTRRVDDVDVIRVPSVRGHLRWWWRALFAGEYDSAKELFEAERKRWGGIGEKDQARRSAIAVEVVVDVARVPKAYAPEAPHKTDVGYVLWPARGTGNEPAAQCRPADVDLALTLYVDEQKLDRELDLEAVRAEARDCVRAWILFGGYGGRTRRGFGGLTVVPQHRERWLPKAATVAELRRLFERGRIFEPTEPRRDAELPRLAGAKLYAGPRVHTNAHLAWVEAVDWLQEFRQGVGSGARVSRGEPRQGRQGRSNWPEPDKVRRLAVDGDERWSHPPRHGATPAWPRAGFGLPIIGQFQRKGREGEEYHEPPDYWIKWEAADGKVRERLASPLILKPMALANGTFVPVALWLERDSPAGQVVLGFGRGAPRRGSGAPFDRLRAADDQCLFPPIEGHTSLRDAFFAWLPKYPGGSKQDQRGGHGPKHDRFRRQRGSRR